MAAHTVSARDQFSLQQTSVIIEQKLRGGNVLSIPVVGGRKGMGIKNEVESNRGVRACREKFLSGKRESYLLCVKCAAENYFLKADIPIHKRNDRN